MHSAIRVGLLGEFNQQQKAHHAIPKALAAASEDGVETTWVSTDSVEKGATLAEFDGLWCVPGMPYKSADGVISAIRFARTSRLPFLRSELPPIPWKRGRHWRSSTGSGVFPGCRTRAPTA